MAKQSETQLEKTRVHIAIDREKRLIGVWFAKLNGTLMLDVDSARALVKEINGAIGDLLDAEIETTGR